MIKRIIFFACFAIVFAFLIPVLIKHRYPDVDVNKAHEERIARLNDSLAREKITYNLLAKRSIELEEKLKDQKADMVIINNKHEKIRNAVVSLPDDSAILYISNRLSKKGSH